MMDLKEHLVRQIHWSHDTFGPGNRDEGVSDHIRKELDEIKHAEDEMARFREWMDVIILGLDGAWRTVSHLRSPDQIAQMICTELVMKQSKNEKRDWPDWRTAEPGKAIEHVRGNHD
jgi:hypothetical protein